MTTGSTMQSLDGLQVLVEYQVEDGSVAVTGVNLWNGSTPRDHACVAVDYFDPDIVSAWRTAIEIEIQEAGPDEIEFEDMREAA